MFDSKLHTKRYPIAIVLLLVSALAIFTASTSCSEKRKAGEIIADAFRLSNEGRYDEAQVKALEAEEMMENEPSPEDKESLSRLYGLIYYQQGIPDKADEHIRQALNYAAEMQDTSLLIINRFNLGLCATSSKEAITNFEQAANLAKLAGNELQQASSLEKLAQVYISTNDFVKAQQLLDESARLCENDITQQGEIAVTQCRLWLAEGKSDLALEGYKSINPDSLNVHGRLFRATAICDILTQKGDYKNALLYKDSVYLYNDSIRQLDGSRQVEEIEKAYQANIERKNIRFQILLWSAVMILTAILIILFFVLKNLQLKRKQVELSDKISKLNTRIAELLHKPDESEGLTDIMVKERAPLSQLLEKKYELSLEMFRSQSQYELLRKLNLIREMSSENRTETKNVYDSIIGRFSGCCSDTRQAFPGMTNDDCIFCTMNFIGCSKEVISVAMGASEEALRRRKSRIKQKLPEEMFLFFFTR